MRSTRHCRKGFTLIELVMTMVVFGIVAIPLSLTIYEYTEGAFSFQESIMAHHLGRAEMERVLKMPYTSMSTASFPGYKGYNYDVTRTVTYVYGSGASAESLKQIQVDVRKSGKVTILASFVTYFSRNVTYGL